MTTEISLESPHTCTKTGCGLCRRLNMNQRLNQYFFIYPHCASQLQIVDEQCFLQDARRFQAIPWTTWTHPAGWLKGELGSCKAKEETKDMTSKGSRSKSAAPWDQNLNESISLKKLENSHEAPLATRSWSCIHLLHIEKLKFEHLSTVTIHPNPKRGETDQAKHFRKSQWNKL